MTTKKDKQMKKYVIYITLTNNDGFVARKYGYKSHARDAAKDTAQSGFWDGSVFIPAHRIHEIYLSEEEGEFSENPKTE